MTTLLVAVTDIRRRIRNRSALITAFAAPLALASVFGILVGGAGSGGFEIGVVDADGSHMARSMAAELTGRQRPARGNVRFTRLSSPGMARRSVDDGDVDAAVVIPAGFAAAVSAGHSLPVIVLQRSDRLVAGEVARAVAVSVGDEIGRVTLAVGVVAASGTAPSPRIVDTARREPQPIVLDRLPLGGRELAPAAFYGASMSIVFLFFTISLAARSVLAERRDGTLARILATPAHPGAVLAGKTLSVAALGLAGLLTVWAATAIGFGAGWGNPAAVVLVMVATVFAIGGLSLLIASLARTEQQADAYTGVVTFSLALLGGNFIGPSQMPDVLRTVSLATPNGWSLAAFTDLSADAAGVGTIATALAVLFGCGIVTGGIGLARVYRGMRM